jgi:hypothetical protein
MFGITNEYQMQLYDQMFDVVYYSKGAFSLNDMRELPILLRVHYVRRLQKILEEKSQEIKRAQSRRR